MSDTQTAAGATGAAGTTDAGATGATGAADTGATGATGIDGAADAADAGATGTTDAHVAADAADAAPQAADEDPAPAPRDLRAEFFGHLADVEAHIAAGRSKGTISDDVTSAIRSIIRAITVGLG